MIRGAIGVAALALVGVHSGCVDRQCNSQIESSIEFRCHWQDPVAAAAESTVTTCLNADCSSGAFGPASSASAAEITLDGALGPVDARLSGENDGTEITIHVNGGNGRYADGDSWSITITAPGGRPEFFANTSATYASHPQICGGQGTYEELSADISEAP